MLLCICALYRFASQKGIDRRDTSFKGEFEEGERNNMNCTHCGQPIADGAKFCVSCGTSASSAVAAAAAGYGAGTVTAPATPATKPCPFCGEQIMQAAVRCRFCNSNLTGSLSPAPAGGVVVQGPSSAGAPPQIVIQNVQTQQSPPAFVPREIKNPGLAMLLSIIFPGGGQFYNGHAGKGILILCTCWLILPWIWGIFDAYSCAKRINRVGF